MKKYIQVSVFMCFLILSFSVCAKDMPRDTIEIGGDFDISVSSVDLDIEGEEVDTDTTSISMSVLYYVEENLGVGLTWGYENSEVSFEGGSSESTTNFLGPAVAYNFSLNENTSMKLYGAVAISAMEEKDSDLGKAKYSGYAWVTAGIISFFVNDSVSFDASLSYVSMSLEDDEIDLDVDGFSTGLGVSVYLY